MEKVNLIKGTNLKLAEMHAHISMALSPKLFLERCAQGRTGALTELFISRTHKHLRLYDDLAAHHRVYESLRDATRTHELRDVAAGYLSQIADEGCIYAEISISYRNREAHVLNIEALTEAIDWARANKGIETRIVVTSLRNYGAAFAEQAVKDLALMKHPSVTGFGLVGDECVDSLLTYKNALERAWKEGFGLAPHVGEQDVQNAIDYLDILPVDPRDIKIEDPRRIRGGHLTLICLCPDLLEEYAALGIGQEICLSSNKRINVPGKTRALRLGQILQSASGKSYEINSLRFYFNNLSQHPLPDFEERGMRICLGSDNPLIDNTSSGKEHSLAARLLGCRGNSLDDVTRSRLEQFTRNAIEFANIDYANRMTLLAQLPAAAHQLAQPLLTCA